MTKETAPKVVTDIGMKTGNDAISSINSQDAARAQTPV